MDLKKRNSHTQNKAKKPSKTPQKLSIIKNIQSLFFRELGNVQTPIWGEKSCNCWCCGNGILTQCSSFRPILSWLCPLSLVAVVCTAGCTHVLWLCDSCCSSNLEPSRPCSLTTVSSLFFSVTCSSVHFC